MTKFLPFVCLQTDFEYQQCITSDYHKILDRFPRGEGQKPAKYSFMDANLYQNHKKGQICSKHTVSCSDLYIRNQVSQCSDLFSWFLEKCFLMTRHFVCETNDYHLKKIAQIQTSRVYSKLSATLKYVSDTLM